KTNKLSLERPAGAGIPLPLFLKVTAGTAFYIKIDMVIFAGFKSSAYTVFKPGVIKNLTGADPAAAIRQRCFIAAAKFVQKVDFGINNAFLPYFFTKI